MLNERKAIIFDLDGTLYPLRGGSYGTSPLKKYVLEKALIYIADKLNKTKIEAKEILNGISTKYQENISLGVEKEFGLDRYDYFKTVWNIPAKLVVSQEPDLRKNLLKLKEYYRFILASDAPLVWIKNVLVELKIDDLFRDSIFSGESDIRKGNGTAFSYIMKSLGLKPAECISVGDQEKSDIIPAKELGLATIFISPAKKSSLADFNVRSIEALTNRLLK